MLGSVKVYGAWFLMSSSWKSLGRKLWFLVAEEVIELALILVET